MKKLTGIVMSLLFIIGVVAAPPLNAEENLGGTLRTVYATFRGEKMEVAREIMEVDGDYHEPIKIEIQMSGDTTGYEYYILQYTPEKTVYLKNSTSTTLEIYPDEMEVGMPVYLKVLDKNHKDLYTRILNFRINKGEISSKVPIDYGSAFGEGFFIDMSRFLPGMKFEFLPCLIPVTVKVYGDGRFVLGMGLNSSDVTFWEKAATGNLSMPDSAKMRAAFSNRKHTWDSSNLGMTFVFSGYVQGNVNTDEPLHGQMSMYLGGGLDITGQYMILTWEITATAGLDGSFDFSIVQDSVDSSFQFQPDRFMIGWKAGIEVFGGLGLASVFAVGVYGAGSFGAEAEFYPQADVNHLILAGELGMKVKLFGKNILVFKLVSGSHDFVMHDNETYTPLSTADLKTLLLENQYAKIQLEGNEMDTETVWHANATVSETENQNTGFTAGTDTIPEYAYLLAENIYPDNMIQLINTGNRTFPEMSAVFLGNDTSRAKGNRSRLMGFTLDPEKDHVSTPQWIDFGAADDTTADLDPYLYHDEINNKTYLVYKNALQALPETATLEEIAKSTDLYFGEYHYGTGWQNQIRVTNLYGENRTQFATGARVAANAEGRPVIVYYLNPIDDPAGLRDETHPVYLAHFSNPNGFTQELLTEVNGSITEADICTFNGMETVAVSYTHEGVDRVELYRNGQKFWEKENATGGRFVAMGYERHLFVWMENSSLYGMNENGQTTQITPSDMPIPSTNYRLYGKFGSESVMIVGTSAKDSRENAFAMLSNNGGTTWNRIDLTNISEYGIVNNIAVAFTYDDEPFVLYSVQKYTTSFAKENTDALAMIGKASNSEILLNQKEGLLLGEEDERFSDTQADLYIKARKANSRVRITEVEFTDAEHAEPQKGTPVKITVQNAGLYPVSSVVILQSDVPNNQKDIELLPGESGVLEMDVLVNTDGTSDAPLEIPLSVTATRAEQIDGKYTAELTNGDLSVTLDHELIDGTEQLTYNVTNLGFSSKGFHIYVKDADSKEIIEEKYFYLSAQKNANGVITAKNKLFSMDGHENVTILVERMNETDDEVTSDRKLTIRSLEEVYAQSTDGIVIPNNDATPQPEPAPAPTPTPGTPEKKDETPEKEETVEPEDKEETPVPEDGEKETEKEKDETPEKPDDSKGEDPTTPEDAEKENETVPEKRGGGWKWIFGGAALCGILFFFLILFKRRKDEEEENQ